MPLRGFALDRLKLLVGQLALEEVEPRAVAHLGERPPAAAELFEQLAQVGGVERGQVQLRHPRPQAADPRCGTGRRPSPAAAAPSPVAPPRRPRAPGPPRPRRRCGRASRRARGRRTASACGPRAVSVCSSNVDLDPRGDAVGRQPVAFDAGRQPDERVRAAGIDIDAHEQFRFGDAAGRGELARRGRRR